MGRRFWNSAHLFRVFIFSIWFLILTGCEESETRTYDWPKANLADQNIDPEKFQYSVDAVERNGAIFSYLVVRNGKLVHESYYNG